MVPWSKIWRCHDLQQLELPEDAAQWPALPAITVSMMRQAMSSFPTSTASGLGRVGVRAFLMLSDEGLCILAALFERCEDLLAWPDARVWHEMVRLPKPSGGCRLITLMDSMIRIWSRVRAPVSRSWVSARPSADIWGLGSGRTPSESAFQLDLEAEIAEATQQKSLTVLMDAF
eukprot:7713857-Pyramimonas_sp.AAC.1